MWALFGITKQEIIVGYTEYGTAKTDTVSKESLVAFFSTETHAKDYVRAHTLVRKSFYTTDRSYTGLLSGYDDHEIREIPMDHT